MTILVGFVPGNGSRAALDLGIQLCRSTGETLLAVTVVPAPWRTPSMAKVDGEYAAWATDEGNAAVSQAQEFLAVNAPDIASGADFVSGRSIAQGLLVAAEHHRATVLVLGSSSDGGRGQITVGSTADRLLHSSPVPLALAPRGYHPDAGSRITRITCAYAETDSAAALLTWTAAISARFGASLRVATFGVRGRTMFPPEIGVTAEDSVLDVLRAQATAAQNAALAVLAGAKALPEGTTTEVATGRGWVEALDALPWLLDEVLVLGSSPLGPVARVFVGSKAAKIIRHSPVPVIVVPAGLSDEEAESALARAVASAAESAALAVSVSDR